MHGGGVGGLGLAGLGGLGGGNLPTAVPVPFETAGTAAIGAGAASRGRFASRAASAADDDDADDLFSDLYTASPDPVNLHGTRDGDGGGAPYNVNTDGRNMFNEVRSVDDESSSEDESSEDGEGSEGGSSEAAVGSAPLSPLGGGGGRIIPGGPPVWIPDTMFEDSPGATALNHGSEGVPSAYHPPVDRPAPAAAPPAASVGGGESEGRGGRPGGGSRGSSVGGRLRRALRRLGGQPRGPRGGSTGG